jgi:hypothetical protein
MNNLEIHSDEYGTTITGKSLQVLVLGSLLTAETMRYILKNEHHFNDALADVKQVATAGYINSNDAREKEAFALLFKFLLEIEINGIDYGWRDILENETSPLKRPKIVKDYICALNVLVRSSLGLTE